MQEQEFGRSGFKVAEWQVDPSTNRMVRESEQIRLEPKVMAVLVHLASRPNQMVSRQELEASVWAGTVVSYDALTGAIQKLRKAFGDDSAHPRFIETLSKKGYSLIAPVPHADTSALPGDENSGVKQSGARVSEKVARSFPVVP
jgi:DNA-binding winged helix-turn-helix (wHTH) protein